MLDLQEKWLNLRVGDKSTIASVSVSVSGAIAVGESPSTMVGSLPPSGDLAIHSDGNINVSSDVDVGGDEGNSADV